MPFEIIDHCYEPPKYSEEDLNEQYTFKDSCGYQGCGRPEIDHLWTVEARIDNEAATK